MTSPDDHANSARADDAEHGRGADARFEAVERERDPERHHPRDDAVHDLLEGMRAGCADRRLRIDGIDGFGEELGEAESEAAAVFRRTARSRLEMTTAGSCGSSPIICISPVLARVSVVLKIVPRAARVSGSASAEGAKAAPPVEGEACRSRSKRDTTRKANRLS